MCHALATFALGLILSLGGRRRLIHVAYWSAYVTGIEVLYRMSSAPVIWEFGKYAVSIVMLAALLRSSMLKGRLLPIAYFLLLLPSALLTFMAVDSNTARVNVSGNLSGPLALMSCALFFSRIRLGPVQVRNLLLAIVIPAVGIATVTVYSTAAAKALVFGGNSNLVTSGGFGPNQVSAALGLAALAAWLVITTSRSSLWLKLWLFGAMGLLAVQSALTFSRGGLYNAAGGALAASLVLMKDRRARWKVLTVFGAILLVAGFVVFPRLQAFTNGALGSRFSNTDTAKRTNIAFADFAIWRANPILGIGPGMARGTRAMYDELAGNNGAHTEFTRLLSEHGIFGLGALVLLVAAAFGNFRRAPTLLGKALVLSTVVWSFLYMTNAAMRLVAPSFMFGIGFAMFSPRRQPWRGGPNRPPIPPRLPGRSYIASRITVESRPLEHA
jgi:O-antigen ligase